MPVTSQWGIVASSRSWLPISQTSQTNTTDLVSSFVSADEMLVNAVLGINVLCEASDPGAAFDAQDHYDRRCFPGNREQYISDTTNWVTESANPPSSMYWMRRPAGVGKLAITQTCAEKLDTLVLHSSSPLTNTLIHHAYSLLWHTNLPLHSLIITQLLIKSRRTRLLLRKFFHFNSNHWSLSRFRS